MKLVAENIYHVYNQGNNKETIFRDHQDYISFLKRVRKRVFPIAEILNYCLMPYHYHFLIYTNQKSIESIQLGLLESQVLKNSFRLINSGFSSEINNKYSRTGSLFRQKTKFKLLENRKDNYPFICFHYIHQNPLKAGLVEKMEDWKYSSFQDYLGLRNGTLCNFQLAEKLIAIQKDDFYNSSYSVINEKLADKLY
jgi:REP element-mobilizing transposase RayT